MCMHRERRRRRAVRQLAVPGRSSGLARVSRRPRSGVGPLVKARWLCDYCVMPLSVAFPPEGADWRLAARDPVWLRRAAALLLGAGAVGLGVAAYRVQVQAHSPRIWAAATV